MKAIVFAVTGLIASISAAAAEPPAALVEDLQGKVTGAELMDYVTPGQVIKIGPTGSIVLSYLKSCLRQTISGIGTVIVGTDASKMVHLSDVKEEKVDCDASHAHATTKETSEVAATVVRSVKPAATPGPQATLYGASPIFDIKGRGALIVERLDKTEDRLQIEIGANQIKGRFYDFAKANRALAPGGTYVASFGASRIVFRIDPQAKPGPAPLLGRLIQVD
jgi:hypothetical protein